jgi:phosphohistidine phosphatase SixA
MGGEFIRSYQVTQIARKASIRIYTSLFVRFRMGFLPALLSIVIVGNSAAQSIEQSWEALKRGEAVALVRHAIAPGTGDPPGFLLGDCSTQRNLSQEGRIQSRGIGEFFRAHGIKEALIYSSQWCRCLETARLMGLGPAEELPALNSFFSDPAKGPEQTEKIRAFISSWSGKGPRVLVTHQVNITALTGVFPSSGEIIIYQMEKEGQDEVLGRFTVPLNPSR